MIAYNTTWLDQLRVKNEAAQAWKDGLLTAAEHKAVQEAYATGLYRPNVFIRIGLFVLTIIISGFTLGFFLLLIMDAGTRSVGWLFIFFSFISYTALEWTVRQKHHFRSGVDDALMFMTLVFLLSGLTVLFKDIAALGYSIVCLLLCGWLWLRFCGRVMGAATLLSLLAFFFLAYIKAGTVAKATTPFLMLLLCAAIYFAVRRLATGERLRHYRPSFTVMEILSLICFYIAGNYFAVREISNEMFGLQLREAQGIPFGWFFWIFTLLVPPLYIAGGIYKKDTLLLRTGMLLLAAMIATIRQYYYLLPIEIMITLGGAVLLLLAYSLIRYLHLPRYGFTYEPAPSPALAEQVQVESLLITETFSAGAAAPDGNIHLGGGTGGGGGATGQY